MRYLNQMTLILFMSAILTLFSCIPASVTLVTGLMDIGRGDLLTSIKRSYPYYLSLFEHFLHTPANLIIFGDQSLE